jgi:hypothetical protein
LIGAQTLALHLHGLGNDEVLLWLEAGLRSVAPTDGAEGVELAFAPLLLSRTQPPMQQFHAAVATLPGASQARLRWACGRLLESLRVQDDPAYVRAVWSLAIAFKPPRGVLAAARRFLVDLPDDRRELEVRRPIIDVFVSAVLSYPRNEEQDNFIAELRRHAMWSRKYTRQYVLYLIKENPGAWIPIVQVFNEELRHLEDEETGFFRRLAKAIGPANLALGVGSLNRGAGLDWLRRSLQPNFRLRMRGDEVTAEVGSITVTLDKSEFPSEVSDDEAEAMLISIEPVRMGEAHQAHQRMAMALSSDRLETVIRGRLH